LPQGDLIKKKQKLNSLNDQANPVKFNIKLKVSKDFNIFVTKNIKQNSSNINIKLESSNTSVINNKLHESPNPFYITNKLHEKEKNDKDRINNFKKANIDKKYSISPTLQFKKDCNSNNNDIGEFKLDLRSMLVLYFVID